MIRHGVVIMILCFAVTNVMAAETWKQREQREAYQKQLEMRYAEVNQKLSTLGNKSSNIKEESKKEFTQLMEELQKKQEAANRKMTEFRSASEPDSERLKAEANAAIDDLGRMYDRMTHLFKSI